MSTPTIILDRAANSSVHNGMLRIGCVAFGPDGKETPSGTIVIPALNTGDVINGLVKMIQDLAAMQQAKLAEQQASQN